jgi:integrase
MAADSRYMKCPRQTWFLVYTIPPDLRSHPRFTTRTGRPMNKITESLGTKHPDEARVRRNERIAYWDRQFRILRHGPSEEDINRAAFDVYQAALNRAATPREEWERAFIRNVLDQQNKEDADPDYQAALDRLYLEKLDQAIADYVSGEIADYYTQLGVKPAPATDSYRKIGIKFIQMKIAAGDPVAELPVRDLSKAKRENPDASVFSRDCSPGEPSLWRIVHVDRPSAPEPRPAPPSPPLPKKAGVETFADAAGLYLKTELTEGVKATTVTEYRRKIEAFLHKDKPLRVITRGMAADFLDGLVERGLSRRTRNLYASFFCSIFRSAIRRERATVNPFDGQLVKAATIHYEPFTDQELATLFADAKFEIAPAQHTTKTALPWCALIGAFTGCRLEEIAQLKASDIKCTAGVWYFEFCQDGNGKTEAATRVLPIHHALIDTGLLQYRDALPADSRLFPSLKPRPSKGGKFGPSVGQAFEFWRKRLGINRTGVNFHSFRHCIGDRLRKAGVAEDDRAAVIGHKDERITSRVYGPDGPGLNRLVGIVEAIEYPGLRLPKAT